LKYRLFILLFILLLPSVEGFTDSRFMGKEPKKEFLGAPLYPGAVFLRTIGQLDPFYETALYITPDKPEVVKKYYNNKLPGVRVVSFLEENVWVWTFLLKKWIVIPDDPSRDDITILEASPNIQVKQFQKDYYSFLIEYFKVKPGSEKILDAIDKAGTIIRYTYEKPMPDKSITEIKGKWRNTDRDLPEFYGSIITFNADSTYTLQLTKENISAVASSPEIRKKYDIKDAGTIANKMSATNPEKGKYSIMRNTITLAADEPVIGYKTKEGLASAKTVTLVIQFVNMPRLTFIKANEKTGK